MSLLFYIIKLQELRKDQKREGGTLNDNGFQIEEMSEMPQKI